MDKIRLSNGKELKYKAVILLVEDDEQVRSVIKRLLEKMGYVVLEAGSGPEGLAIFEARAKEIDIVLIDLVIPGMDGRILNDRIKELNKNANCIFMSGRYDILNIKLPEGAKFIPKPFLPEDLTIIVRELMKKNK